MRNLYWDSQMAKKYLQGRRGIKFFRLLITVFLQKQ